MPFPKGAKNLRSRLYDKGTRPCFICGNLTKDRHFIGGVEAEYLRIKYNKDICLKCERRIYNILCEYIDQLKDTKQILKQKEP